MSDPLVGVTDLHQFVEGALTASGATPEAAVLTAKGLVAASIRGTDSHGVRLLPHYVAALQAGRINKTPNITYRKSSVSTGVLDANHGFGHHAGIKAMDRAIELAQSAGTGFVAVQNSSHCGALAYFALEACRHDMIGWAFTHASPKVLSPGSPRSFVGINPMCIAVPLADEEPFVYDSAPTSMTSNKLKLHAENNIPLPPNVAADDTGTMTLDANRASQLYPIGDYKGFGLAMVVDILCGMLSGMPVGRDITMMYADPINEKRFLGQFFGAMRIDAFQDTQEFKTRMQNMVNAVRAEPAFDPEGAPVLAPGDPEKRAQAERKLKGVPLPGRTFREFADLAAKLDLPPVTPLTNPSA